MSQCKKIPNSKSVQSDNDDKGEDDDDLDQLEDLRCTAHSRSALIPQEADTPIPAIQSKRL